mmetsp:Transcript_40195/g.71804  ORF Transcript_40195/g.71804 Transcript_40195/m.71804 type:complete len:358 (-) Transcript_40195:813-1886(-)
MEETPVTLEEMDLLLNRLQSMVVQGSGYHSGVERLFGQANEQWEQNITTQEELQLAAEATTQLQCELDICQQSLAARRHRMQEDLQILEAENQRLQQILHTVQSAAATVAALLEEVQSGNGGLKVQAEATSQVIVAHESIVQELTEEITEQQQELLVVQKELADRLVVEQEMNKNLQEGQALQMQLEKEVGRQSELLDGLKTHTEARKVLMQILETHHTQLPSKIAAGQRCAESLGKEVAAAVQQLEQCQDRVNELQEEYEEQSIRLLPTAEELPATAAELDFLAARLQRRLQSLEKARGLKALCDICVQRPRLVHLGPCKHQNACEECAPQVRKCGVCKGPVKPIYQSQPPNFLTS